MMIIFVFLSAAPAGTGSCVIMCSLHMMLAFCLYCIKARQGVDTRSVSAVDLYIVRVYSTLQAPLSGTFFQTLPDLVTSLKGHSLSPRNPKGSGTNMTVETT